MQSEVNLDTLSIDSKYLFEQLCTEKKLLQGWREVRRNPGRNQQQAVEAAQKIVQSGKKFIIDSEKCCEVGS